MTPPTPRELAFRAIGVALSLALAEGLSAARPDRISALRAVGAPMRSREAQRRHPTPEVKSVDPRHMTPLGRRVLGRHIAERRVAALEEPALAHGAHRAAPPRPSGRS